MNQANTLPSTRTARGHQGPAGFLILASGLDKVRCLMFYFIVLVHCSNASVRVLRSSVSGIFLVLPD